MIKLSTFLTLLFSLTSFNADLTIDGEKIIQDDKEIKLLGLRCSNALISDKTTDDLISHLDLYQEHGLNTVSVFLMGSRFGDIKGALASLGDQLFWLGLRPTLVMLISLAGLMGAMAGTLGFLRYDILLQDADYLWWVE